MRNHRSIALIFGILLVASIPACAASNISASLPIAYSRNSHDVYLLYSNGISRDVTTGQGVSWAPDHKELLVDRVEYINPPSSEIWMVSTSGKDIRQVTFVYPDQVLFFAAGKYQSTQFMAYDTEKGGIKLLNLLTEAQQTILASASVGPMTISPDGARIAFAGGSSNSSPDALYVTGTYKRSQLKEVLPPSKYRHVADPSWSPDGQWIAVSITAYTSSEDSLTAVWLMHPDGTGLHMLTMGDSPQWSPDGQWVSYVSESLRISHIDGSEIRRISNALFKIHPDGTDRTQLTPYTDNSAPSAVDDASQLSW